jgi:integrase
MTTYTRGVWLQLLFPQLKSITVITMKVKLTQKYIDNPPAVPANKAKIEHCDIALPGLLWEQRAINQEWGSFRLRYKSNGKTAYVTVGRSCDITLADARQKTKQLKAEIQLGADPRAEAQNRRKVITVEEYAIQHFIPWIKVRKRSWKNDESLLRLRILPALKKYRLDQVTRHQIELLHNSVLQEGKSGALADHLLKTVRFMYTKAIEQDFCKSNPAAGVKQFNFDNRVERYLDDDELARLLAVLETDSNRTVADIILMLLATGMRLNECLTATWKSVDRKNRTLTIDSSRSKSKKRKIIPLNDMAMDILDSLGTEGKHTHLFVSSRTGKPLTQIRKSFLRIISGAQIEGFRIHDLRHCFCSYALQQGRSIAEVSQLAGHSSVQITMRYAHFAKGQLHAASNSAADHIAAVREANSSK